MREAHDRARETLDARHAQMDTMARVLLARETVEGDAVQALLDDTWAEYVAAHPDQAVDENHDGIDDAVVVPEGADVLDEGSAE